MQKQELALFPLQAAQQLTQSLNNPHGLNSFQDERLATTAFIIQNAIGKHLQQKPITVQSETIDEGNNCQHLIIKSTVGISTSHIRSAPLATDEVETHLHFRMNAPTSSTVIHTQSTEGITTTHHEFRLDIVNGEDTPRIVIRPNAIAATSHRFVMDTALPDYERLPSTKNPTLVTTRAGETWPRSHLLFIPQTESDLLIHNMQALSTKLPKKTP